MERYQNNVTFLITTNILILKVVQPRTKWVSTLGYEVLEEEIIKLVEILQVVHKMKVKKEMEHM